MSMNETAHRFAGFFQININWSPINKYFILKKLDIHFYVDFFKMSVLKSFCLLLISEFLGWIWELLCLAAHATAAGTACNTNSLHIHKVNFCYSRQSIKGIPVPVRYLKSIYTWSQEHYSCIGFWGSGTFHGMVHGTTFQLSPTAGNQCE